MAGASSLGLGVGLICGAAFIGLVASRLRKEERNRALGLPDDYTEIPVRLGWLRRMGYGAVSLGGAGLAAYVLMGREGGSLFLALEAAVLAAGFAIASLTGRLPQRLRRWLGAELPASVAAELRRRSEAHRRDPERAIPLDATLEPIEQGLR